MIWAIARGYRLTRSDAADVAQTTWLRFVEHLDRINQTDRVGACFRGEQRVVGRRDAADFDPEHGDDEAGASG